MPGQFVQDNQSRSAKGGAARPTLSSEATAGADSDRNARGPPCIFLQLNNE